jgi:hypothetical protein
MGKEKELFDAEDGASSKAGLSWEKVKDGKRTVGGEAANGGQRP